MKQQMCHSFDCVARIYDSIFAQHIRDHYIKKRVMFIKKYFKGRVKILDVGCGTGLLAYHLAQCGWDVYGLDFSPKMVEIAKIRLPGRIVCGHAKSIPFPSHSVDGVLCVATLHHIPFEDLSRVISEMVRVLKPGGRLLIWDHNKINPYWRFLMKRVPQDTGRERIFSAKDILEELKKNRIEIIKYKRMGFVPDFCPEFLMPLFVFLEKGVENVPVLNFICAHNVIIGEKRYVEE